MLYEIIKCYNEAFNTSISVIIANFAQIYRKMLQEKTF